jgi:hypothetical protein
MRNFTTIYYLLFVIIIMGAFASMAQNNYGIRLLAVVAGLFAVLFFYQAYSQVKKKFPVVELVESLALALVCVLLVFRLSFLYFSGIEWVFLALNLILAALYLRKTWVAYRAYVTMGKTTRWYMAMIPASVSLFFLALALYGILPTLSTFVWGLGFFGILMYLLAGFFMRPVIYEGEKLQPLNALWKRKDRALVLVGLFFLFSLYAGLTRAGILPFLYSNAYPQAYFRMLNDAERLGTMDKDEAGKAERFKKMYLEFVRKW